MEAKTGTDITTVKHEVRLRKWRAQIEAQQASGMTVQEWCAKKGISPRATAFTSLLYKFCIKIT